MNKDTWSKKSTAYAVRPQVMIVINQVAGCHYFPTDPRLTSLATERHRPLASRKL